MLGDRWHDDIESGDTVIQNSEASALGMPVLDLRETELAVLAIDVALLIEDC